MVDKQRLYFLSISPNQIHVLSSITFVPLVLLFIMINEERQSFYYQSHGCFSKYKYRTKKNLFLLSDTNINIEIIIECKVVHNKIKRVDYRYSNFNFIWNVIILMKVEFFCSQNKDYNCCTYMKISKTAKVWDAKSSACT